jgi:hypothetical protein
MIMRFRTLILLMLIALPLYPQSKRELRMQKKAEKKLSGDFVHQLSVLFDSDVQIDSIAIRNQTRTISLTFSPSLSNLPIREGLYFSTVKLVNDHLGGGFQKYELKLFTGGKLIEQLIPNFYRQQLTIDSGRFHSNQGKRTPIVRQIGNKPPTKGLHNRNIALWGSHGCYYESRLDRWEWQRARLFTTVEDLFPTSFVLPYLTPMLENAGAYVFMPRERDMQVNEVIVDNDHCTEGSQIFIKGILPETDSTEGFLLKHTLIGNENPFQLGTHLKFRPAPHGHIEYVPHIPQDGRYAVYVSYQHDDTNSSRVKYEVQHDAGISSYYVNQQIGGGTWVYLGTFYFRQGFNRGRAMVRILSDGAADNWITTDAVRFGGGMGNVARRPKSDGSLKWKVSGKPRYQEGARYYLQYAGFPEKLVYSTTKGTSDYKDDYQSRGEWVNYLMGAPNGPTDGRNTRGLNIPIDLALAFHTDAGTTMGDSTIGTLAICSTERDRGLFPTGQSKMASRDLSDIVQSEIVNDIRTQFEPNWSRRALWDREYSEAWRPNAPAMLLELLSHQNLADMRYGLDPRFKFAVSRAIYKGIAKFLSFQNHSDYVIQPLPVDHLAIASLGSRQMILRWQPVLDSLEETAEPTFYKVYQRIGTGGFDDGSIVEKTELKLQIPENDEIYSFYVTALNEGGESFPSEVLSLGLTKDNRPPVLVVNGFDRLAAPNVIEENDFAGFAYWHDEGVPDRYDFGFTGPQYDFDRQSPWLDDDSPGWGASYGNMEGRPIPGNSFDNIITYGKAIMRSGRSFISMSDEAFTHPDNDLSGIADLVLIFGEEKTTETLGGQLYQIFNLPMQKKLHAYTSNGGNVFASGAHIGSDVHMRGDTIAMEFSRTVLHFGWRSNYAAKNGHFFASDQANRVFHGDWKFNTIYHPKAYRVEAPDGLTPVGKGAIAAFRYHENKACAGVAYNGDYKTVILGIPFEAIADESERAELMAQILRFFEN